MKLLAALSIQLDQLYLGQKSCLKPIEMYVARSDRKPDRMGIEIRMQPI